MLPELVSFLHCSFIVRDNSSHHAVVMQKGVSPALDNWKLDLRSTIKQKQLNHITVVEYYYIQAYSIDLQHIFNTLTDVAGNTLIAVVCMISERLVLLLFLHSEM